MSLLTSLQYLSSRRCQRYRGSHRCSQSCRLRVFPDRSCTRRIARRQADTRPFATSCPENRCIEFSNIKMFVV